MQVPDLEKYCIKELEWLTTTFWRENSSEFNPYYRKPFEVLQSNRTQDLELMITALLKYVSALNTRQLMNYTSYLLVNRKGWSWIERVGVDSKGGRGQ